MSEIIQTLDTNEGKNPGEAISSYGRSIVFLPTGTPVGKRVRVKLEEITTKKDSRGRTMYKAVPADVEYTERWKDNGDGTASCVAIATNWVFEETEEGAVETRKLKKREGNLVVVPDLSIRWGNDRASSNVANSNIQKILLEEEKVFEGRLTWVKTGERQEPGAVMFCPITEVKLQNCDFKYRVLETRHDSKWSVMLTVSYRADWGLPSQNFNTTFGDMPEWWRKEMEACYPVCSCGRQRRDTQVGDGYGKCELCRAEQVCERCGKQARVELNQSGRNVCETCKPWETKEKLITHLLSADHLATIAAEARRLRQGQAFPREEGLMILKSTLDPSLRLHEKWSSTAILNNRVEWQWYYFCKDGTYGSVYSPAALGLLSFLTQATGDALVELVSWIAEPQFYLATQVRGESVGMPSLTEPLKLHVAKRLERGETILSDHLRGSEADRIEAVAGYRRLVEILGKGSEEVEALQEILHQEEQDYAQAVAKIRKIEGKRASVQPSAVEAVQSGRLNLAALRENWGAKVKLR